MVKNHWDNKKIFLSVLILTVAVTTFIFFLFSPKRTNAAIGIPTSGPTTAFGGRINFTLNCEDPKSCMPINQFFPICLIVRCIFQVPFILHEFSDYAKVSQDAFDRLREDVLEPGEKQDCLNICTNYYAPYYHWKPTVCPFWCGVVLSGLQAANISPVGIKVKILKEMVAKTVGKPAMVMVTFPNPGAKPACNSNGYVIGRGFGQGLFFTSAGGLTPAGDSCRGSYYLSK
jgi:hypothetical protein